MLHDFLIARRGEILDRSRGKLAARQIPLPRDSALARGLPLFLDQLIAVLRTGRDERSVAHATVSASATRHGGDLLRIGLTVGQVVQDYGSICQSVTELADENNFAITADEFKTFNHCLDDAIAHAVTEYQYQRDRTGRGGVGVEYLGFLAHEMRNLLMTSMLMWESLTRGRDGVKGSTGTLLGRSLQRMRILIDRTLAEVRLEAGVDKSERVSIAELIAEIEVVATLEANVRGIQFSADSGSHDVAVDADHQILASVVANLVQNALKFTPPNGHIAVRTHTAGDRVLIDVEDECGGLPPGNPEDLFLPFEQRGVDQNGLGLGLSLSLKGVRASGGEIHVRDLPGRGCMFTVDLPRAPAAPPARTPPT